ncbi:MAG: CBS domain-containing protein [Candidatus Thorarchaeota archaeon]
MEISQIMVEPITIDKDQRLSYAMELMEKKNYDRLVVVQGTEVIGILTYADIADRLGVGKVVAVSIGRLHVSSAMSDTVISVSESDEVTQVASLMVERGMSGCPVLNKEGKLVGLVTKKQITELVEKFTDIKVDTIMTTEGLMTVNPAERLIKARLEMLNGGYSGLPVTDGRRVLGVLTERTVAEAMARFSSEVPDKHRSNQIRLLRVVDAMIQQPPLVQLGTSISEAAKMMLESGLNALPVVGEGNMLIGVISATDFTRFASNKFRIPEKGD